MAIGTATKLQKEYAADKIVDRLEKLHPHFYPRACIQTEKGPEAFDAVIMQDGFLTKTELSQLYHKCGDALHRGSLTKLISLELQTQADFSDIRIWQQKNNKLLSYHIVFMLDNKHMVLFVLRNAANKGRANWVLLRSDATPFSLRNKQNSKRRLHGGWTT